MRKASKQRAPPWSAGTCHRFGTASLTFYNALYQSGDKSPHSKEAPASYLFLFDGSQSLEKLAAALFSPKTN
ncbi:MAG TPA: hypothetical protein VGQ39_09995, partial [Pyrinomonadaceae bacterium]|nr:hypothetical protein [Pyrinomonadaceae bacterium]